MVNDSKSNIVNSAYHATIITTLTMVQSQGLKRFLKIKPPNLSQLDAEDILKLTGNIGVATIIKDWLIVQGYIPENIME